MKQVVLLIEQMRHLQDLGLDTSDASMFYDESGGISDYQTDIPTYTLQDILLHLTPLHRQIVMRYEPDELLQVAYEKLVFQLTHKEDFK